MSDAAPTLDCQNRSAPTFAASIGLFRRKTSKCPERKSPICIFSGLHGTFVFLRLTFCSVRHHEKSHLAIAVSIRIDNSCDGLLTDVLVIPGQYIYVRNRFKLRTCVAIACVHARRSLRYRRDLGTKASKQHVCPAARGARW